MNRSKNLSGISYDSGIGLFKEMLKYKAVRAVSTYKEFSERNSTRTCSKCNFVLPWIGLGVRSWICEKWDSVYDRDTNAAINILRAYQAKFRMGHHTPIHARETAGMLSPVPVGVGPMTIAMLVVNTAIAAWG